MKNSKPPGPAALHYAKQFGWYVIPLHTPRFDADDKLIGCSCSKGASCTSTGKHPRTMNGVDDASIDPETIARWWRQWPDANVGIAAGMSGLVVLDEDDGKAPLEIEERFTVTNLTGRGEHLIYKMPPDVRIGNNDSGLPDGVNVRGHGGLIVVSPSIHPSGKQYQWEENYGPHQTTPLPLPQSIIALLYSANGHGPATPVGDAIPEGNRNKTLTSLAGSMVRRGMSKDALLAALMIENSIKCHPPLPSSEVEAIAKSVMRYEPQHNGASPMSTGGGFSEPNWTDLGNTERMYAIAKDAAFYVPSFSKWYLWNGTHWSEDRTFAMLAMAKRTILGMYESAGKIADDNTRKDFIKWIRSSESRARLEAMIALLRAEDGISVEPAILDQRPMLLPCINGTIDLSTGDLLPPDPSHKLTMCLDINYDPSAECPQWESFLFRIMADDLDLIAFIQRLIGHALTGDASGKYLVFMYGPKGNNGKSTLVETLTRLLGPYAMKSPTDMITVKKSSSGIPNDIARLRGVRFTVTNEVDEDMKFSESILKDLTGNDTLTARFLHGEYFDFRPTHKLWIYGNKKPEIRGTDAAIWDRVKLIPFEVEIPEEERDPHMSEKLALELPGILAWAVRGCMAWQRQGINPPESVAEATADYRTEQDILGLFIDDCCAISPLATVPITDLYKAYESWCNQGGTHPAAGNKFGAEMQRRGYESVRTTTARMRKGLQLNEYGQAFLVSKGQTSWVRD